MASLTAINRPRVNLFYPNFKRNDLIREPRQVPLSLVMLMCVFLSNTMKWSPASKDPCHGKQRGHWRPTSINNTLSTIVLAKISTVWRPISNPVNKGENWPHKIGS